MGGGEVAYRKVVQLRKAGAEVQVVATSLCPQLAALADIKYLPGQFLAEHLDGIALVVAATDDTATNEEVSRQAKIKNIPVNVVDNPALCSFIFPAILDRSPLVVAFSTGGVAPVLSRMLRAKLEALIPHGYGRLAAFAAQFRQLIKTRISNPIQRRIFWEDVLEGPVAEKIFAGDEKSAGEMLQAMLHKDGKIPQGEVYLVGAGPGDPDLLTFRALRLMQKADVVLYDNLVSKPVLDMTRRDAERIFVGKMRSDHTMPQESINELLIRLAKSGQRVVRLKGGDPFIFGRGGEEVEHLQAAGIAVSVVNGITSGLAAVTSLSVPLTHREYAHGVVFVTGHAKRDDDGTDWQALAAAARQAKLTLVIYMGISGVRRIQAELLTGLPGNTPVAVIQNASLPNQRHLVTTLDGLAIGIERETFASPAVLVVGDVIKGVLAAQQDTRGIRATG